MPALSYLWAPQTLIGVQAIRLPWMHLDARCGFTGRPCYYQPRPPYGRTQTPLGAVQQNARRGCFTTVQMRCTRSRLGIRTPRSVQMISPTTTISQASPSKMHRPMLLLALRRLRRTTVSQWHRPLHGRWPAPCTYSKCRTRWDYREINNWRRRPAVYIRHLLLELVKGGVFDFDPHRFS